MLSSLIMTIVIGGVFSFHRSHGGPANHLQVRPGNGSKRLWIAAAHLPESQCKGRGVDLIVGLKSVHAAVARNVRPGILRELAQGCDDAFRISGKEEPREVAEAR